MADPRCNKPGDALDGKRMIFGGFEMIVAKAMLLSA